MHLSRRSLMAATASAGFAALFGCGREAEAAPGRRVNLTEAQWRDRLTPAEFRVLRQAGTERPFSSPLNEEHRNGTFICAGCDNHLYSSETKFESGTGWPSFYRPLADAITTRGDSTLGITRTEVRCADCGGHLGHVFNDGPRPTGKRYCMNGVAMDFVTA